MSKSTADVHDRVLTIVIPALNEEDAIGSTIERCLAAREHIKNVADLDDIEIIVVSDGSTDRTPEIARGFDEVHVIEFEQNQGYGAAIKEGWRQGKGELLSFLDADGTCSPEFFGEMSRLVLTESGDVVLGARLGPDSEMPKVRRLGNRIYALLLGFLCGRHVTDTASGMRVVRRSALSHLYPLPDGLHFTPSMSARAMLNNLRVIEIPMTYKERIGESKLNVLRDGVRFLQTIFSGVLCYRPEKLLLMAFMCCVVMITLLAVNPVEHYLEHHEVKEWMLYRLVVCTVLGSSGLLFLLATAFANRVAFMSRRRADANTFWAAVVSRVFKGRLLWAVLLAQVVMAIGLLWPGMTEYVSTGHITLHWSRLLAGAFVTFSVVQTAVFALLMKVVEIWKTQEKQRQNSASHQVVRSSVTEPQSRPADQARVSI